MREWEVDKGGVGLCPRPVKQERRYRDGNRYVYREYVHCKCAGKCAVCGFSLHASVHMHSLDGKPGDAPFDHRFVPADTRIAGDGEAR